MPNSSTPFVDITYIIKHYDTLLFDAYGVLVDREQALPGASKLINYLNKNQINYGILTNGSSSTTSETSKNYRDKGLNINRNQIISSGSLIEVWLKRRGLKNSKSLIVGNQQAYTLAQSCFCDVVKIEDFLKKQDNDIKNIIICNQSGFSFVETMDTLLSYLVKRIKNKDVPNIIVPNPDFIYPINTKKIGITSGAISFLLEKALSIKLPQYKLKIHYLGKPYPLIFNEARKRFKGKKMIMIGDQLITDIKGANLSKIDSALLLTGINDSNNIPSKLNLKPTFMIKDLSFK